MGKIKQTIARAALPQHGYLTRQQLLGLGVSSTMIGRWAGEGYLIRVHQGVYAVGHEPWWPIARAHAAVLACGEHSVLGLRSGLSLWGAKRDWVEPFDVLAPGDRHRRGIIAHRFTTLAPRDVTLRAGIPCTTIARTVFDAAARERGPARLVREARNLRGRARLHLPALAELITRFPRHPSAVVLRPHLTGDLGPTRSELEDRFVWLIRTYGLPVPELNVPIGGRIVDALYRRHDLIVELDSRAWHADPERFESDRDRDADHLAAGLATARVTWERMQHTPGAEAARLQRILKRREKRAQEAPQTCR